MNPAESGQTEYDGIDPHPLDWVERTGTSQALLEELEARRRRRVRRRRALAGIGAAAILVAGVLFRPQPDASPVAHAPANAAIVLAPERRTLPDGSMVELKEGASIAVEYGARIRRVVLRSGDAHFEVARNEALPFVVTARGVDIRAVGTAFAVHTESGDLEVLVTHGRVAVERGTAVAPAREGAAGSAGESPMSAIAPASTPPDLEPKPAPAPLFIGAGDGVVLEVSESSHEFPSAIPLTRDEIVDRLAWRVPRIEFSGTPLSEAIALFNQYCGVRIVLGDPALATLRLSGILRADNVDALVRLLEANFGVSAAQQGEQLVLQKRRG